ncbi:MAG: hypothetical protein ACTSUC_12125 [Promethearchaeota archaeon]
MMEGLVAKNGDAVVNHIVYMSIIDPEYIPSENTLLNEKTLRLKSNQKGGDNEI